MCLNKFVIFRMCGEEKVKVAHLLLFSVFLVGVALLFYVRSLYRAGSLATVTRELARYKLDLVGVQEVRWDRGAQ